MKERSTLLCSRPSRRCLAAALPGILLWVAAPGSAGATGSVVPEIGSRKMSMGAVIGRPDDLSAIYHNPAGLTLSPGTNLYVSTGLALIDSWLRARPWDKSDRYIKDPVDDEGFYPYAEPTGLFGVIPMIVVSTSALDDRLMGALSIYVPNAVGASFPEDAVTRYHLIDSYVVAGNVTATLAYKVADWLSVGAGFSLIYMKLHARRYFFPVVGKLDLGGFLGGESILELNGDDVGFGANVGVLLSPPGAPFTFGLTLISRTDLELEGPVRLEPGPGALLKEPMEGTQRTDFMTPWIIQGGLHWDLTSWLEVGAEIRYYVYHQLVEQRTELEMEPISSLLPELTLPKHYMDSWQASGGFKIMAPWLVEDLELMIGMIYSSSPVPDRTLSAEQPSFDRWGLHTGVRYRFNPTWRVTLSWSHYQYLDRSVRDSLTTPPSNIDCVVGELRFGEGALR
jgi:long-chain fatty acid transport protein